jgi:hypothetical protein
MAPIQKLLHSVGAVFVTPLVQKRFLLLACPPPISIKDKGYVLGSVAAPDLVPKPPFINFVGADNSEKFLKDQYMNLNAKRACYVEDKFSRDS